MLQKKNPQYSLHAHVINSIVSIIEDRHNDAKL
jgi:hypothetical protein